MTYSFQVTSQLFTGHTVPGSARIQVHNPSTRRVVAAFDPDVLSLTTNSPSGEWVDPVAELTTQQLEQLKPQILEAARSRLLAIRDANRRTFEKRPELFLRKEVGWFGLE